MLCILRRNPGTEDDGLSLTFSSSLLERPCSDKCILAYHQILMFFFPVQRVPFDGFFKFLIASGLEMKWLCAYNVNFSK